MIAARRMVIARQKAFFLGVKLARFPSILNTSETVNIEVAREMLAYQRRI